jgi:D-tagatose-1,6-bisphosphate aldolase subunit GatZ/KbaZ
LRLAWERCAEDQLGIYSVCSAHPWVLEAAMRRHRSTQGPLLIEATCNQVNQYGGYTGMKPGDFRDLVHRIALKADFPVSRILLGGDHLGPFPWQHLNAEEAMGHACEMVSLFAREGFSKIHLDASMPCADDPHPLPDSVIAERAARLCTVAESSAGPDRPVYVIGTEVPTPGGAVDTAELSITSRSAASEALRLHRESFSGAGLDEAWERVIALVVQPGVEFGHETVDDYEASRASHLSSMLAQYPGLIFEAHSTDYQTPESLSALVRDGFAILKVGPGLTYAMRQALFSLAAIEDECVEAAQRSRLRERIEAVMLAHPDQWRRHYAGTPQEQHRLRIHSYSDRMRYYWIHDEVQQAVDKLVANLQQSGIPDTMLSDFLPVQYRRVRSRKLAREPLPLILDAVGSALDLYIAACRPG